MGAGGGGYDGTEIGDGEREVAFSGSYIDGEGEGVGVGRVQNALFREDRRLLLCMEPED